jgi:hypothetical protein
MKRYNIDKVWGHVKPRPKPEEHPEGEWVRFEDASKYEDYLIEINKLIFAKGIDYTGDDYWAVRAMCAEAMRNKDNREMKI